jgi:putative ABC transport system permease protein
MNKRILRWFYIAPLRVRSFFHRDAVEGELDEEIRDHIQRDIEKRMAEGMTPAEARLAAMRAFGGVELVKDQSRDAWGIRLIEDLVRDVRYNLRALRKTPAFACIAVLTLAFGIGVNTMMYSLLWPLLYPQVRYPESDRIMRMYRTSPHSDSWPLSVPAFLHYQKENSGFEHLAALNWTSFTLSQPGETAERKTGMLVTGDFFPVLGVQPQLGRPITADDDSPGAGSVVVISHALWAHRFAGDAGIIGRRIRVDGVSTTVIGVMPESFDQPILWGPVEMWRPFKFSEKQRQDHYTNFLNIVGRLKPGTGMADAEGQLKSVAVRLLATIPDGDTRESLRLEPMSGPMNEQAARFLEWLAFGVTGLVLLIACVNLANLQLARATTRAREFALRAALGGARTRLLQQSITESILIALAGGALAIPAAVWSAEIFARRWMPDLNNLILVFNTRLFLFAFLCSLATGLLFGAGPAWLIWRVDANELLKEGTASVTTSRRQGRLLRSFIIAEMAITLVLLAGTGLFLSTLDAMFRMDRGWHPAGVLTAQVALNDANYASSEQRAAFYDRLQTRLSALPRVESVALSTVVPVRGFNEEWDFAVEGQADDAAHLVLAYNEPVSVDYFKTMGMRLQDGRTFTSDDVSHHSDVVIINEAMARRLWPQESPIGKHIGSGPRGPGRRWHEIVGVVNDLRFPPLPQRPPTDLQVYRPFAENAINGVTIALRHSGPTGGLATDLRHVVEDLDRDLSLDAVSTAQDLIDRLNAEPYRVTVLLAAFAGVSLLLAAIGVFGVTSYSVAQRTGEIGIRIALGAQRLEVLWLVLKQGLRLALIGVIWGAAADLAANYFLAKAVPEFSQSGLQMLAAATIVLLVVSIAACLIPSRRAFALDPVAALRHE